MEIQDGSKYVQTVPDEKTRPKFLVFPSRLHAFRRFHDLMSRCYCVYQISVCFPDFRAFMSRLPCVHVQTFVRSFPDFFSFIFRIPCVHFWDLLAFMYRLQYAHIQTFVCSCPDYLRSYSGFCALEFVSLCPDFRGCTRLTLIFKFRFSCVHVQIFVDPPDFR